MRGEFLYFFHEEPNNGRFLVGSFKIYIPGLFACSACLRLRTNAANFNAVGIKYPRTIRKNAKLIGIQEVYRARR